MPKKCRFCHNAFKHLAKVLIKQYNQAMDGASDETRQDYRSMHLLVDYTTGIQPMPSYKQKSQSESYRTFFRWLLLAGLLLASLPFIFWTSNYFVADDWPVLARSQTLSLRHVHQWFLTTQFGWYRPLFDFYMAVSWRIFGLNPMGYHVLSIVWYVLVSIMVGLLGWLLTGNRNVTFLSTLIFSLHSCHSTVVMWISSANELLAGFFTLASIACYILYRRRKQTRWLLLVTAGMILAISSKETALFLPIAFLLYDILFYQSDTKEKLKPMVFLPGLLLFLFVIFHVLSHPPAKASSLIIDIPQIAKNIIYYLAMQLLTVSTRYNETLASPISLVIVGLAAVSLLIVGVLSILNYIAEFPNKKGLGVPIFTIGLTLISLMPVMFEIWERTAFISSAGVALTLSVLFIAAWSYAAKRTPMVQVLVIVALALWLSTNAFTLVRRNYRWVHAGDANKAVMEQLASYAVELPDDAEIWLVNLPDRYGNAFAFRNTFPIGADMMGYQQIVHPILDVELANLSSEEKRSYYAQLQKGATVLFFAEKNIDLTQGNFQQ